MSDIGNQGRRPTCVAFALTACHEFQYFPSSNELSKDSLHWGCVLRNGPALYGVSAKTAIDVLQSEGQHLEEAWPYRPDLDELVWESLPPPEIDGQTAFKISDSKKLEINDPDVLCHSLGLMGPIFVILKIWESFFLIKDDTIPMPNENIEEFRGNHAVCIVGLTTKNYILIRNSWGNRWGKSGYAIMPFEYLKKYGSNIYSLKVNLEER